MREKLMKIRLEPLILACAFGCCAAHAKVFDVREAGAKGDGKTLAQLKVITVTSNRAPILVS